MEIRGTNFPPDASLSYALLLVLTEKIKSRLLFYGNREQDLIEIVTQTPQSTNEDMNTCLEPIINGIRN